ncbi:hypothetical protein [Megamonas funiformis]|jgi:uncharacterized phage infection (PIP) family protein YhgE|uniref:hypothetical protein n=1 Tax=Megamonas funiformis TaxID=437897 RepID=UPI002252B68E|nr:hypothetical protein [Megamonas funiformis]MCX4131522.1 hypothetical protein [Megamonas funiformis]
MNEIVSKIKNFFMGNYKTMVIVGGIIIVCFLIWYVFSGRENVSSNGVSTNDIRTELSNAQDTKSDITDTASDISNTSTDIAETVGNLAESIDTATGASSKFDAIIDECTGIIDQIRKQPAGE